MAVGSLRIILDPALLSGPPSTVTLREVSVCKDGAIRKMMILASEEY